MDMAFSLRLAANFAAACCLMLATREGCGALGLYVFIAPLFRARRARNFAIESEGVLMEFAIASCCDEHFGLTASYTEFGSDLCAFVSSFVPRLFRCGFPPRAFASRLLLTTPLCRGFRFRAAAAHPNFSADASFHVFASGLPQASSCRFCYAVMHGSNLNSLHLQRGAQTRVCFNSRRNCERSGRYI